MILVISVKLQILAMVRRKWNFYDYPRDLCLYLGAYGVVYRAIDVTGRYVALKKIRISLTADGIPMTTLREIALLKNLDSFNHPHIVKWVSYKNFHTSWFLWFMLKLLNRLLDVIHRRIERENQLEIFLVFEYLEGDLANYISRIPQNQSLPVFQIQVSKKFLLNLNFIAIVI
jgi:cyclin-dependent kinase 4